MEKKLSKKERLEILSEALADVQKGAYICIAIAVQLDGYDSVLEDLHSGMDTMNYALLYFPEFLKYKPKGVHLNSGSGWFGMSHDDRNTARRVEVMERLIAEIKEETESN
jgi:hypothetical protein